MKKKNLRLFANKHPPKGCAGTAAAALMTFQNILHTFTVIIFCAVDQPSRRPLQKKIHKKKIQKNYINAEEIEPQKAKK